MISMEKNNNPQDESQQILSFPALSNEIKISQIFIDKWQKTLDVMADFMDIPCGLITKVSATELEVFVSSITENNPLKKGDCFTLNGNVYCETTMKTKAPFHIPNALKDPEWDHNPSIEIGLISYLGYPLLWPDGSVFGTICMLDTKENHYSDKVRKLIAQFKELISSDLALLIAHAHIKTLSGLLPICSNCKKIRDESDKWNPLEEYIKERTNAELTHSFCPQCAKELFPGYC